MVIFSFKKYSESLKNVFLMLAILSCGDRDLSTCASDILGGILAIAAMNLTSSEIMFLTIYILSFRTNRLQKL